MKLKPVNIGNVVVKTPVMLAPLAGVTDKTFRSLCRECGAGFVCTEMISAKGVIYKNKNTALLLSMEDDERPCAVQLFGSEPDALSRACEMISDIEFDVVDFNMGCPVPKVVKNFEGSYLMKDLNLAQKALTALVKAAKKPVTVKIRSGFDENHINAPEAAAMAQEAGVSAITVHARTRQQYYSGRADRVIIRKVKEAVSIPVFGNGDITDGPSAVRMFEETGCDGIVIGRAAMGNPWIFSRIIRYIETGTEEEKPSAEDIYEMIIRHARLLCAHVGEYAGIRQMRAHASNYVKGFRDAASLRRRINQVKTLSELEELFS